MGFTPKECHYFLTLFSFDDYNHKNSSVSTLLPKIRVFYFLPLSKRMYFVLTEKERGAGVRGNEKRSGGGGEGWGILNATHWPAETELWRNMFSSWKNYIFYERAQRVFQATVTLFLLFRQECFGCKKKRKKKKQSNQSSLKWSKVNCLLRFPKNAIIFLHFFSFNDKNSSISTVLPRIRVFYFLPFSAYSGAKFYTGTFDCLLRFRQNIYLEKI